MATKVKPCRIKATGTPQVGYVPKYVDEDTFQWGAGGAGSGDVTGPASSTDGHLAVFDGATGKLIKDGGPIPTGDVGVSTDTGTLLSAGVDLWLGTETDFSSISTPDTNTLYIQYKSDGGGGGWQPGANTIAYYKFDGNLNDSSGNNRNMSLYTGTVTYGTTSGGKKYGHFNTSTWTYAVNFSLNGAITVLIWVNPQTDLAQQYPKAMLDISPETVRWFGTSYMQVGGSPEVRKYTALSTNTRYLLACTLGNGDANIYVNGSLVQNGTAGGGGSGTQTMKLNQIWDTNRNNYSNDAYYSEMIIEDKARTAQEIADYYNQTKANYGIS